jgi:hypothetical protein
MLLFFILLAFSAPNRLNFNIEGILKELGVSRIVASEQCIQNMDASSNDPTGANAIGSATCELFPANNIVELPTPDIPKCVICLEEFQDNCDGAAGCARCPQKYHAECKSTWLNEGENGKTCPACKMLWPEFTIEVTKQSAIESLTELEGILSVFVAAERTRVAPSIVQLLNEDYLKSIFNNLLKCS